MSVIEKAQTRVREIREKGVLKFVEEKVPRIKEMRSGGSSGSILGARAQLPSLEEVRTKGVLGVIEERFPRVKEVRERGVLAKPLLPAREEREIAVEEEKTKLEKAAVKETRLSVEV